MSRLSIHLLGPFHVTLNGEPVTGFESGKVRALLAYLAVEADRPHSRDALIGLLWPDQPERVARRNLSQALFNLREAIEDRAPTGDAVAAPFLRVTRREVQINSGSEYWVDATDFAAHVAASDAHAHPRLDACEPCLRRLEQAVELYRGEFLAGFFVEDAAPFVEWATLRRERCHRHMLDALYHLAQHHERRRDYERARRYAWRQVELEPWREEAHQQLMRLLARGGQRGAALQQYETCCRVLADELGVEPGEETTALCERIRASGSVRPHNLPDQPTPFVGREEMLSHIAERLEDSACRLLTLVGPGGIGKTRLALQAAREALGVFLHGVHFVPLSSVSSAEFLVSTVADGLGFQPHGARGPLEQLLDYLRAKELLLVMDSFEHLREGAGLLTDILKSAPHVKILVTSRERMSLRAEWLLEVEGLAYPQEGQAIAGASYDAVDLFCQNASRVRAGFTLSQDNQPHVARICQLLEGIPLGIELASAWARTLSCEQIAEEIQRDLDFLATSLRDVPERHRSMRAVFDHAFRGLSGTERVAFCKLSTFRGGFQPEAAEEVAGVSLSALAALVDKSLLHRTPADRYGMHELLRQYAADKLRESPGVEKETRALHSAYYADFLHRRDERLKGREQKSTLDEVGVEIDNVRDGWWWAVEHTDVTSIDEFLSPLYYYYDVRGRFQEGEAAFERAAAKLSSSLDPDGNVLVENQGRILGRVLARQGKFCFHLGRYERARDLYQTSLAISCSLGDRRNEAFSLVNLGFVSHVLGEHAEARRFNQESLAIYQEVDDQTGIALCLNNLGNGARSAGNHVEARELYEKCLAIRRQTGDAQGIAVALNNLGNIAEAAEAYAKAQSLYEECRAICQDIGYRPGMAASLTNLGYVAWKLGECEKAEQLYQDSLTIKRELGDRRSIVLTLINLGEVTCTLAEYRESKKHFDQALRIALEVQLVPLAIEALVGAAILLSAIGEEEKALELCACVLHHPASGKDARGRAKHLFSELASRLEAEVVREAQARGEARRLEELAEIALAE